MSMSLTDWSVAGLHARTGSHKFASEDPAEGYAALSVLRWVLTHRRTKIDVTPDDSDMAEAILFRCRRSVGMPCLVQTTLRCAMTWWTPEPGNGITPPAVYSDVTLPPPDASASDRERHFREQITPTPNIADVFTITDIRRWVRLPGAGLVYVPALVG